LLQANKKCYDLLEPFEHLLKDLLVKAKLWHMDETSVLVNLVNYWVHVISNAKLTYLSIHESRGAEALAEVSEMIAKFKGTAIHDFFKMYFNLGIEHHGMCGAHILRELQNLKEKGSAWACKFHDLMMEMYRNSTRQNNKIKRSILNRYTRILNEGFTEEPSPQPSTRGQHKKSKGLNLLIRLRDFKKEVTAFAFDPNIPFTNNTGERDQRNAKIKMKVAGCFRSVAGAHWYFRITSFISTLRKNNQDVYSALRDLFSRSYAFNLT
jgi:transposase